ncbi:MAG: diguanylate cyclase [Gemmobacter sp.]|nr:diguanylate cyclase [Gemmobacter sp.]
MTARILIVDEVATNRIILKAKLGAACYQPLMAADGRTCLQLARETAPDALLLATALPDLDGMEVLRQLRADPVTAELPILMVTADPDPAIRLAALRAGADDILTKPLDDAVLMARLRNLLRTRATLAELGRGGGALQTLGLAEAPAGFDQPGQVVIVTARCDQALHLRREIAALLGLHGRTLTPDEALAEAADDTRNHRATDLFVIDADSGGAGAGLRLMSELRSRAATRHAAVLMLLGQPDPAAIATAFDLGAHDVQPWTTSGAEQALRLRALLRRKRSEDRLRMLVQNSVQMALIDPLTGLYNRRYAMARLTAIEARARETAGRFAVMVVDLDRFKSVNDRWGHAAGDMVLIEVAHRLGGNRRAEDLVARIGGEEFLVVLPDTDPFEASRIADRLRRAMEALPITLPCGASIRITVSIGLMSGGGPTGPDRPESAAETLERADRALLLAKTSGRNQVIQGQSAA